jgi:choline-sulfatase
MAGPNLLFILSDDHAGYAWGADGDALARTPSLDRLAAGGVRFASHYCNAPLCTPSRQSILTGQMPHSGVGWANSPTSLADEDIVVGRLAHPTRYRGGPVGPPYQEIGGRK